MPRPTTGSEGPHKPYLFISLMVIILFVKFFKEEHVTNQQLGPRMLPFTTLQSRLESITLQYLLLGFVVFGVAF